MESTPSRREFLKKSALIGGGAVLAPRILWSKNREFDVILRSGSVIDGTGRPPFIADIGIIGDKIEVLGSLDNESARRIFNVKGLTVTPGFIDIHSHSNLLRNPGAESKIFQGVTFDITGNCGGSAFPRQIRKEDTDLTVQKSSNKWENYQEWKDSYSGKQIAMNLGTLIGHGTVRRLVMGSSARKPDRYELSVMEDLVKEAMENGALGLSTGLEYNPDGFAHTEEVAALAKVAAEYDRLYATHMRSEDQYLLEALEEAIQVCRETGVSLQISHLKTAGKPNWHKLSTVIGRIEEEREKGLNIHCDRYPYLAYSTGLSFFFPGWSKEGGNFRENLRNSVQRERMKKETLEKVDANGGWETVMIVGGVREDDGDLLGKKIDVIAREWSTDPYKFVCDLLLRAEGISIVGFGMSESNTDRIIGLSYCMIGSDGYAMRASPGFGHPRSFGAFPKAIREYVREKKIMSLQEMIRKMTSLPAGKLRLTDRGRLIKGSFADIAVFNADTITDTATYLEPNIYAAGVEYLFVNGEPVIEKGKRTEALPGRIISRAL